MFGIIAGTVGFGLFFLYDAYVLALRERRPLIFASGFVLLTAGTVQIFAAAPYKGAAVSNIIFGAAALFLLALLIYTLFFALPAKKTYTGRSGQNLVSSGVYSLCRHPGVLWLFLFYLFSWLLCGSKYMLIAWLLFSALDIAYVIWQDVSVFPKTIPGYDEYKKTTPFLIPSIKSIKNSLNIR